MKFLRSFFSGSKPKASKATSDVESKVGDAAMLSIEPTKENLVNLLDRLIQAFSETDAKEAAELVQLMSLQKTDLESRSPSKEEIEGLLATYVKMMQP